MSEHLLRLLAKLLALLTLLVPGLVPDHGGGPRPDRPVRPDRIDLSGAAPAPFDANGSVEQVWLTGAQPGQALKLVARNGKVVATGEADAQGSLILRDVEPRRGYRVAAGAGAALVASPTLEVTAPDDPPEQAFYESQELDAGYGYLETRDGTLLSVTVRLPGPAEDGPYPTLVEYGGYPVSDPGSTQPSTLIGGVLGYATVSVNIRGTGCSGGAFEYFETLQATDGYDVVETVAAQDWVKHNHVGMVGLSYSGISQLFVAQWQPPSLAAIAPMSVIADTVRGTLAPGGIPNSGFAREWAEERKRDAQPGGQRWAQRRMDDGDLVCIANQALRAQSPDIIEMIETNEYWTDELAAPLTPEMFVHRIEAPTFLAGAWQDEQTGGYFANMFDDFTGADDAWFTAMNGGHTDALGPATFARWMEFLQLFVDREVPAVPAVAPLVLEGIADQVFGVPVELPPDRFADVDDHAAALARFRQDPRVRILFDNGAGGQPGAPVPVFETTSEEWPLTGTVPTPWYLGEGGDLLDAPPAEAADETYRYDTSRKDLTTFEGGTDSVWRALPPWRWTPPAPESALAYETDPLSEPLVMAGSGSIDLWLRSTAPDVDLQATISEVRPDGVETLVQSGWLRASHRALHPDATELRPIHPHTEESVAPLPAGEYAETRLEMFPFAHAFREGSRVRIVIDTPGGTRPRWKFNVVDPGGDVFNTLGLGGAHASKVVLPVLADVEAEGGLPPCPSLRFQPCRDGADLARGVK
jgi:uncharacterized protein